jgi:hypothetical protein
MPPKGFETAVSTSKRPHNHALGREATGIGVQMAYRAMKYKGVVIFILFETTHALFVKHTHIHI